MANATTQVFTKELRYEDANNLVPMQGGSNAKTYQNGQFIGEIVNGAHAGYFTDCDDSQVIKFVGTLSQPGGPIGGSAIVSADADGDKIFRVWRGFGWRMKLNAGTATTLKYGDKVYASDNQSVTLDPTTTTYRNKIGRVIGIHTAGSTNASVWSKNQSPWVVTGGTHVHVIPEDYFADINGLFTPRRIPLMLGRNSNYTVMDASGGAGKFAIAGTIDTSLYLLSEGAQNNTKTDIVVFETNVPDGYQATQNLTLTINAQRVVASGTTLTTSLTVNVYLVNDTGLEGSDICATSGAQAFTNTAAADIPFTITGTTLIPGSRLFVQVTGIATEGGNAGTVKVQLNSIRLQ